MDITEIFESHFEQCNETIGEFKYLGKSYRGKWSKNESMALFLKDLIEGARDEAENNELRIADLKKEIEELEAELEDAKA